MEKGREGKRRKGREKGQEGERKTKVSEKLFKKSGGTLQLTFLGHQNTPLSIYKFGLSVCLFVCLFVSNKRQND